MKTRNIAVFASGRGSNARAILEKETAYNYHIALIIVSNPKAAVLHLAKENNRPFLILDKKNFQDTSEILEPLKRHQIDLICLAGFLWKVPPYLIQSFPDKIINIHPALLPKYSGKGMYGIHVHKAVVSSQETTSGITIHLVNEEYDKGRILHQETIHLNESETAQSLADRILVLEHKWFPKVIGEFITP
jgi:phosphoribosylglycinamide formyltransferase-1